MKFIFILLFVFSYNVFAQDQFILGEGRFLSIKEDSLTFVKQQLLHIAIEDIVSKELVEIGFNKDLFWKKFNDKFDESYLVDKEKIDLKYKIKEGSLSEDKLNRYRNSLRYTKLNKRRKFGGLSKIVQRYEIKRMSRSPQNPHSRYLSIEAKIDRDALTKIYFRFVSGKKSSNFGNLYVKAEYELVNCSYSNLGVDTKSDFTNVIMKNWLDWFSKNKPTNMSNVLELEDDLRGKYKDYLKIPIHNLEEEIPDEFQNSLLVVIKIKINRIKENNLFKEYVYSFSGGGYLKDLSSGKIIYETKIPEIKKHYTNLAFKELSSTLANIVYRIPFSFFVEVKDKVKVSNNANRIMNLKILNYKNMTEIVSLLDILKSRGLKLSLDAEIASFSREEATALLYYDGQSKDVKKLLENLKQVKNIPQFNLIDSDSALSIQFKHGPMQGEI